MKQQQKFMLSPVSLAVLGAGLVSAISFSGVHAAGFQISEQSVSGLGRAFAGAGVAGDDASDMFYNPGGMMILEGSQFQVGSTILDISGQFTNEGSTQRLFTGAGFATVPSRGVNSDGGDTAIVPHMYYSSEMKGNMKFGLSISAPFGLKTEYDSNWTGRYHALTSELKTVDINPSVAWEINDSLSAGFGISIQHAEATLSRAVFQGPGAPDGKAVIEGDNVGFGFNFGAMFTPNERTRIGFSYRSKIKQEVDGHLTISGTPRDAKIPAVASVDLPETIYLSAAHDLNDKLSLFGTARWTKWSRFEELRIKFAGGLPDDVTPENWKDSTTLSIGLAYRMNDRVTLRAGYSSDESPVPGVEFRTPRIPDSDRDWLTLGATFKPKDNMTVDVGYAYLTSDAGALDNTVNLVSTSPGAFTDTLRGSYKDSSVHMIGAQVRWEF